MSSSGQGGPGEPSGSGASAGEPLDPVAAVEAALGAIRGRGPAGAGGPFGPHGGHERQGGHDRQGEPFGGHPHHARWDRHGGRGGPGSPRARGGPAALRLLIVLANQGPRSVSDLADAIGVDQPRASRLVQAAVDAGYVRREVDPRDARRSILVVTDAGRATLDTLIERRHAAIENALADFTPAEREEFARLFTRFAQAWQRG